MFFQPILYLHFYTNLLGHERKNFKINYYCTRLLINQYQCPVTNTVMRKSLLLWSY